MSLQSVINRCIARPSVVRYSLTLDATGPLITAENSNDCNQSMLQLEELFANEFLRSSIPLNDFSSLGDFVQYTPMPLDGHFPEPPPLLSETGLYREQTGTPHSKPTPISPYSPQNDKVGGLGSLRPDTALQRPGKHIPPGLFIGIDKSLTGFIGR